ncbi:uncharacterized protein [Fopius arisanus]|uniref:NOF_16 protein n=1 Tax=Fopius arisanus TaxID=64838 RepID=A0A0C9R0V9_9HYME|nr:PREDICTED: uncharacterized protein LOC105266714 [Fopius arisanus]XP_011303379.1 PREDICTED: uncharacterized protein LOC105266714 [Fopius arisanus]XP_011303380.1 PREDICTED: uncharacterized protein LOC105266714 [Fopius arisanus]
MSGRPRAVLREEFITLLEKYIEYFATDDIPIFSHNVWKQMYEDLGGRWSIKTLNNRVRQDTGGMLTAARANRNISIPPREPLILLSEDEYICEESVRQNSDDESDWHGSDEFDTSLREDQFPFLLETPDWDKIKPDGKPKGPNKKLKKEVWAAVFSKAFWRKYKFPCAFLAKNSHVRLDQVDPDDGYFCKVSLYCKDKEKCKNKMIGVANKPPDKHGLKFIISTRDTRNDYHREVQRPLRGVERKEVGQSIQGTCASNYQEQLIEKYMEFGQNVPHFIRSKRIYRQAKMETNKENHGLARKEKVDVIKSIQTLAGDSRYPHSIHNLGAIDFFVWYCIPQQIHVFKEYCRVKRGSSQIAIDASGKFVRKFDISETKKTGHIFVFTITINFENTTLCVNQMLSTIHTQEFIENWIKHWKRLGAPSPSECISDYERAIPLSAALAFNNMSLKTYVDECFLWANLNDEEKKLKPRPAPTLILIDVAHVMAFVAKWQCLKGSHPYVKSFILKCVALLIDAQSVKEFREIFLLLCIVALQPCNDTFVRISKTHMTVREARNALEELISSRSHEIGQLESSRTLYEENTDKNSDKEFTEGEDGTTTHQWIKGLIATAKSVDPAAIKGESVNAFYLPSFINQLERIAKEFPLWSAAAIPIRSGHVSTAYQEGYFSRMRSQVFEKITLPCQANVFLKTHMDHLLNGSKMMFSKLTHFLHREEEHHSSPDGIIEQTIPGIDSHFPQESHPLESPTTERSSPSTPLKKHSEIVKFELKRKRSPLAPLKSHNPPATTTNSIFHETDFLSRKRLNRNYIADDSDLKSSEPWGGLKNSNVCPNDTSSDEDDGKMSPRRLRHRDDQSNSQSAVKSFCILSDLNQNDGKIIDENLENERSEASSKDEPVRVDEKVQLLHFRHSDPSFHFDEPQFNSTTLDHSYCNVSDKSPPNLDNNLPKNHINEIKNEEHSVEVQTDNHGIVLARFKAKIGYDKRVNSKGCHFQPCPEIKILNSRGVNNRKKGFLLRNGLCLSPVLTDSIKVWVKNTCGFDSILHILQFTAFDNPKYLSFISTSTQQFLKLLKEFQENGPSNQLYSERLKILRNFYPIHRNPGATILSAYELDAEDFLTKIWSDLLGPELSAVRIKSCSNRQCPPLTKNVPFLMINEREILNDGYKVLQRAVQFTHTVLKSRCTMKNCSGLVTETTECNKHILIDVDIRTKTVIPGQEKVENKPMQSVLEDFPKTLVLDKKFRLAGVIAYKPGHFIAYCLRTTGTWLKCDDTSRKIEPVKGLELRQKLTPHGLIYVEE